MYIIPLASVICLFDAQNTPLSASVPVFFWHDPKVLDSFLASGIRRCSRGQRHEWNDIMGKQSAKFGMWETLQDKLFSVFNNKFIWGKGKLEIYDWKSLERHQTNAVSGPCVLMFKKMEKIMYEIIKEILMLVSFLTILRNHH